MRGDSHAGFTLAEVLVATILVAAIAAGAATLVVRVTRAMGRTRTRTVLAMLALSEAERLRAGLISLSGSESFDKNVQPLGFGLPGPASVYMAQWSAMTTPLAPGSCASFDVGVASVADYLRNGGLTPADVRMAGVVCGAR